eukprot:459408-Pelagomonas_calceolata.AAC.1
MDICCVAGTVEQAEQPIYLGQQGQAGGQNCNHYKKNFVGRENSPYISLGKGDTLARKAVSPLHHKAAKQKMAMGIWRVTGSTRLQNLAVR